MNELEQLRAEVSALRDRAEIQDLFSQFAAAMDAQDWQLLRAVFTDDAVVDHTASTWDGGLIEDVWTGIDEVMERMIAGVSRHFAAQHIITNHRIVVDGDCARAVAYLHSVHLDDPLVPDRHGDHGAWYLCDLRRTANEWRISRMKHTALWRGGDMHAAGPVTAEEIVEMREYLR